MTKTLTEQWREGTLPLGTYYIVNKNGDEEIDRSVAVGELWNNTDLKEVLAPVPSYDENNELVQKIHRLEQDREILKSFIVRHHPEMEWWIRKNFGRVER